MKKPVHTGDTPEATLQQEIARNLRRAFQEQAEEAVPGRFLDLLAQLRAQDEAQNDR